MGIVWLAYDEVLHRSVAVKEVRLPPGMPAAEAASVRERTLREARAIAALTHPNVISVFDVARHNGEPYVVMELVASRSLAELIRRHGACSTEQAAQVADSVAAALEAAHRRGITHRDVKPGNVLIGDDGQIKLTDFGIARNMSEVTMTSSGLILGTPAFIAPEAAAGDPVTPAADLWGLGATLYAAVTGDPPYDAGDDPVETVTEVVHGEIPRLPADSPLADVVSALMVKDPDARMSLVEVRRRIRPLLPDPGASVFPPNEPDEPAGEPRRQHADQGPASPRPPSRSRRAAPAPAAPVGAGRRSGSAAVPGRTPRTAQAGATGHGRAAGGRGAAVRWGGRWWLRGRAHVGRAEPGRRRPSRRRPAPAARPRRPTAHPGRAGRRPTDRRRSPTAAPAGSTPSRCRRAGRPSPSTPRVPGGTAVHYVKPDGTEELTVEWYPRFYPDSTINDYLQSLRAIWPASHRAVHRRVAKAHHRPAGR